MSYCPVLALGPFFPVPRSWFMLRGFTWFRAPGVFRIRFHLAPVPALIIIDNSCKNRNCMYCQRSLSSHGATHATSIFHRTSVIIYVMRWLYGNVGGPHSTLGQSQRRVGGAYGGMVIGMPSLRAFDGQALMRRRAHPIYSMNQLIFINEFQV